jgi:hypothetical protein
MRGRHGGRSFGGMFPVLRLAFLTLAVLLVSSTAAHAASSVSVAVPAEGQVAVAVASGVKAVKVKSAPAGVTVSGGVAKRRLAVAVVRPRGVAASGKVVFSVRGKAKGVKTFAAALDGGRVSAGCADLGALLGKRLKGRADVKALGGVLAAKLCGKPAPSGATEVLTKLGLGAAPAPPAPPAPATKLAAPGGGQLTRPGGGASPTPTPTPPAGGGGKRACDNGIDDDGDGQTDWADPGCSDAGDTTENSEVPVSAECAANSGIGMGDDPTSLGAGINSGCGIFSEVEIDVAPGIASCSVFTANSNFDCEVFAPTAHASARDGKPTDMADVNLELTGPVQCDKLATIALHRPNGEVAELREPVGSCKTLPAPAPKCDNGKDDDGDGMIDSRDSAGTTDPDPGCSGVSDTSENSETPTPASCQVQVGIFGGDKRFAGLATSGCGVLKGVWFRPPGTATDCLYEFTGGETQECSVKAGTAGASFALTNQDVTLGTHLSADATCRPVTVALLREDGSVWADRVDFC